MSITERALIKGLWSSEQDAELFRLKQAKRTLKECAVLVNRPYHSVKERWRRLNHGDEMNESRRIERRSKGRATRSEMVARFHVPPEVIEDAIRRAMAPRTITAIICGDPEPGRVRL